MARAGVAMAPASNIGQIPPALPQDNDGLRVQSRVPMFFICQRAKWVGHDLGRLDVRCTGCNAMHWTAESSASRRLKGGEASFDISKKNTCIWCTLTASCASCASWVQFQRPYASRASWVRPQRPHATIASWVAQQHSLASGLDVPPVLHIPASWRFQFASPFRKPSGLSYSYP